MIDVPALERKFCQWRPGANGRQRHADRGLRVALRPAGPGRGHRVARGAYARCLQDLARSKPDGEDAVAARPGASRSASGTRCARTTSASSSAAGCSPRSPGRGGGGLIEAKAIDGLSIGYRTRRSARDTSGRRCLSELELWEVSLVTFPMLADARVVDAKAQEADTLHDLAVAIDDARRMLAGA